MSREKRIHLDDEDVFVAVVDESDLPAGLQEHLSTCPECRKRKEAFAENLARLGQVAERLAPLPRRKVSIPAAETRSPQWWPWGWRRGMVAVMAAAAVVVVAWLSTSLITTPESRIAKLQQELLEDDRLMAEVRLLEENALPPLVMEIAGESHPGFDHRFMRFVVPIDENETMSYDLKTRGTLLC